MAKKIDLIRRVQFFLLIVLLFLMAISYHPTIISMSRAAGMESGTILSRYVMLVFAALFIVCFSIRFYNKSRFLHAYSVLLIIIGIIAFVIYAFVSRRTMITEVRTIFISLAAAIIGWSLAPSDKELYWIVFVFGGVTLFSGIMQVIVNIGGFRIANYYLTDSKNSLGAMLGTGAIAFLFTYLVPPNKMVRLLSFFGFAMSSFVIVTIRARAAFVAVFAIAVLAYYLRTRNRNIIMVAMGSVVAVGLLLVFLPSSVTQYITDSMTAGTQSVDITSGRLGTYQEALAFLSDHLLFGNVTGEHQMSWIHNYPLLQMYRYGLVLSFPILVLYVYLIYFCAKKSYKLGVDSLSPGFMSMLVLGVISLVEPTFPFGPGTVTIFNFLLLGAALRKNYL